MTTEIGEAVGYVVALLRADTGAGGVATLATGGIWSDEAPANTDPPYVIVTTMAGTDIMVVDRQRIATDVVVTVRAVAAGRSYPDAIAARIDTVLHRTREATPGAGQIGSCHRVSPLRFNERDGDRQWKHQGGTYRLFVNTQP